MISILFGEKKLKNGKTIKNNYSATKNYRKCKNFDITSATINIKKLLKNY